MARISIYLTNLGRYVEGCLIGEWVKLPITEDKLQEVLTRIGINEQYEEYFITDYECIFGDLHISEYASITELNNLVEQIEGLADPDVEKLAAILEYEEPTSIAEILQIIEDLDSFDLLTEVTDDEALGYYYAELGAFASVPEHLQCYIDMERYGRDIRMETTCCYTSQGLVIDNR